jgi:urease accessory protein
LCAVAHPTSSHAENELFAANRAVGRVALAVKSAGGVTRRARLHEQDSLRVRCPGAPANELEAVIVNTAGGMAGGDRFDVELAVGCGARLLATTAAAEKIYRTLGPETTVSVSLKVAGGAQLSWLPRETILFNRARLARTIEVDLASDAQLLLLEATVFGRSGMGETVDEGRFLERRRIHRDGKLVHAEAVWLDDAIAKRLGRRAVANGGIAIASLFVVPGDDSIAGAVRALASQFRGEVGASAWNGFAVVRLVAADGAVLHHDLLVLLKALRGPAVPRLWLN